MESHENGVIVLESMDLNGVPPERPPVDGLRDTAGEPIAFDVVLPPSLFEWDDLVKRTLTLVIYDGEIRQVKEAIDVPKESILLQGFEADAGNQIVLFLVETGLEDRQEVNDFGRRKPGQVEVNKTHGEFEAVLVKEMWCPAGQLGIRTVSGPPANVESFQNEEAMRRLE